MSGRGVAGGAAMFGGPAADFADLDEGSSSQAPGCLTS